MKCRHCRAQLKHTFLDLGFAPPSNAYLTCAKLKTPEIYYPLKVKVCAACFLVQTEDYAKAENLFNPDYAYFSSTSEDWLLHAKKYSAEVIRRFDLNAKSFVLEIASNDGYLLKNFVQSGIPCLGIEPTHNTALAAERLGIRVLREFFGVRLAERLAKEGKKADLVVGNNVYAHVPDINEFTEGIKIVLGPKGVVTLEFQHLMRLIENIQFDTVYHEHFSYLSLHTASQIFLASGLRIWHVEELKTHGGSLRIYGCHDDDDREVQSSVYDLLAEEQRRGLQVLETYLEFQPRAQQIKNNLLSFLIEQKRNKKIVLAYGAAAKGSTLLNYAGVRPDLLEFVCDAAPSKQGLFMPGSHIPIIHPDRLLELLPDYLLILPWNILDEIIENNIGLGERGTKFVTAVPQLQIL